MSIVDLASCIQEEGESTTHWVRRVSTILHSSNRINADSAVLMLENNCHFTPLKQKLGRIKHHCNDMGTMMGLWLSILTLMVPRTPSLMTKSRERERRAATPRGSSIPRRTREATVSAKLIIVLTLWLTPMHRIMVSVGRVKHPRRLEGQESILSSC